MDYYQIWQKNIDDELSFWRKELALKADFFREQIDNHFELFVGNFIKKHTSVKPKILDAGSGPICSLGYKDPRGIIQYELIMTDALAEHYQELLNENNLQVPIKPIKCDFEKLSTIFEENYFDFIHTRNALDHSYDPLNGIRTMLKILKSNCTLLIRGYINEGKHGFYRGLHQWNFDGKDDKFIIWNESNYLIVNDHLDGQGYVNRVDTDQRWISVEITKN